MTLLMNKINFNQELTGQVKIYCDGKGAIEAISNNYNVAKTSRKHYDLIQAIWTIINRTKIKWLFIHVKGHQDEHVEYGKLTRIEKLNIMADNIAKTFNYSIADNENSHIHLVLPFQRFRIWINNTFITGNFRKN